ncbi:AAA family ATPase [Chitinophaga tropicalis]|uniref:AAA family ATPase n=1 Tax=Chitinophaga tropicalis TaxID=2683588 RepID=A0A7K1TYC2_9BACT|nr:ATP-binding protein [Chitinophaga tropicalis]MVT07109.1 AAA family ATPase [Chitinophaga tropicalis]
MLKVVVIGPESTGKSTLSERLAGHYQTMWVPEYARQYLDELSRPYEQQDLLVMAEGQLGLEEERAALANGVLVCDTDLHVIKVWSEHKYGDCDPRILEMIAMRRYDLYLLTYIDIPWEEDPQREHPDPTMREYFYQVYKDIVVNSGVPWVDIRGSYEERLQRATEAVDKLLKL